VNHSASPPPQFSIRLSLAVGFLMLAGKSYAYLITGSAAIFSDAAESVIHVFAVSFATFSLWLSLKPPDADHPYGHDKISFFSAGMEGMLIVIAAGVIIYEAIQKWVGGLQIHQLENGIFFVLGATLINAGLGSYLVWQGKRSYSIILVANGKHVLTDSWTSLGVILGLLLVLLTGWKPFDPILAIAVALNILWSGGNLIRQSVGGLMDEENPQFGPRLQELVREETTVRALEFHELRTRFSGASAWLEVHLLFPRNTSIEDAHRSATEFEEAVKRRSDIPVNILTHLEPIESHDEAHARAGSSETAQKQVTK
jgi:cation diffusion facilitator family transporter